MDEERIIDQRLAAALPAAVEYPDSDGLPMAESEMQADAIRAAFEALKQHYRPSGKVYIASDLLLYYVEGDPGQRVAPDLMVVFGVDGHRRPSYKLWEEGKPPAFVLEVSSPSSREGDRTEKTDLYAGLGVLEYFLFDPGDPEDEGDGQDGSLTGYRLWGQQYVECGTSDGPGREILSETLRLWVRPEGKLVRFRGEGTGRDLATHREDARARERAEQQLETEARARQRAEQQRDDERRSREEEHQARLRAEAELAELKARLQTSSDS